MGNTKNTGYLQNIVQYDASNNITLPANLTVTGTITGYATTSYVGTQLAGYVPTTRTISINGTSLDLSANRSFTINSMVYPGAGIAVSTGSAWGTSLTDNSGNWNTAFGWGNHAGLYSLLNHTHTFASLTSIPTTLVGYGITDAATSAQGTSADTAYGWGNHAIAGYLTGITSGQVTTALGFTPYNATNPTGYITSAALSTYATQTYVGTQIANLVASSPAALDTLNELAAALGNDAAFSTTVSTALGNRLRVDINTQGLNSTQQGNGRTNLGLGTAATSNTGDFVAYRTFGTAANSATGDFVAYRTFGTAANNNTGDFAAASHTHSIANVTGLQTALDGKQASGSYAAATHSHIISDVTGLQTALDGKQASLGFTPYNSTNPSGYITSSGSISGNAATATYITSPNPYNSGITDATTAATISEPNSRTSVSMHNSHGLFGGYATTLSMSGYERYGTYQISGNYNATTPELAMRNYNQTIAGFTSWTRLLSSANYSSYALPLTGGTLSGTLNFSQPVGLGFANGQYIKDNGSGGLVIYSGAAININGTTVTAGTLKISSASDNPTCFTNADLGNTFFTDRGGRILTSNGTNWASDGRDAAVVISGSYGTTTRGLIGLAFHNETTINNSYSPMIAFSSKSGSGGYNTVYASIMGKYVGVNAGVDSNWGKGELHFYAHGDAYVDDTPTMRLTGAGYLQVASGGGSSTATLSLLQTGASNAYIQYTGGKLQIGGDSGLTDGIYFNTYNGSNYGDRVVIKPSGRVNIIQGSRTLSLGDGNYANHILCDSNVDFAFNYNNGSTGGFGFFGGTGSARFMCSYTGTLTVAGDVIAYGTPSDARLKDIKEKVPNALESVLKLNGYKFDWKEREQDIYGDDKTILHIKEDIGVIAQEVEVLFPELARTNEDGYMSVRYQGLTAVLIEAIKEQQTQIESQKSEIEELKDLVQQLINR